MTLTLPAVPLRRAQLFQEPAGTDRPYICGIWIQPTRIFATDGKGLYHCAFETGAETDLLVRFSQKIPAKVKPEDDILLEVDEEDGLAMIPRIISIIPVKFPPDLEAPDLRFLLDDQPEPEPLTKIGLTPSIFTVLAQAWPKDTTMEFAFQGPSSPMRVTPHSADPWDDFCIFTPVAL